MHADLESELRARLATLRTEHRCLDTEITQLELLGLPDQLKITRLKKKKLALKDEITALEDRLFPDIIA
ncbi:MAG: YdcH family protein [Hyphomicrobiaceae bacterium]